jgi:hypothetical protein
MATLKKGKLDAVVAYLQEGNEEHAGDIADLIDVEEAEASVYIRAAKKRISELEPAAPVEQPLQYQLRDDAGLLRDLEVLKQKGNLIILQTKYIADTVPVIIRGEEVVVDLNELRKMGPDELKDGIKVSVLLAAAELARL